jgi:hypothetical protein
VHVVYSGLLLCIVYLFPVLLHDCLVLCVLSALVLWTRRHISCGALRPASGGFATLTPPPVLSLWVTPHHSGAREPHCPPGGPFVSGGLSAPQGAATDRTAPLPPLCWGTYSQVHSWRDAVVRSVVACGLCSVARRDPVGLVSWGWLAMARSCELVSSGIVVSP